MNKNTFYTARTMRKRATKSLFTRIQDAATKGQLFIILDKKVVSKHLDSLKKLGYKVEEQTYTHDRISW